MRRSRWRCSGRTRASRSPSWSSRCSAGRRSGPPGARPTSSCSWSASRPTPSPSPATAPSPGTCADVPEDLHAGAVLPLRRRGLLPRRAALPHRRAALHDDRTGHSVGDHARAAARLGERHRHHRHRRRRPHHPLQRRRPATPRLHPRGGDGPATPASSTPRRRSPGTRPTSAYRPTTSASCSPWSRPVSGATGSSCTRTAAGG